MHSANTARKWPPPASVNGRGMRIAVQLLILFSLVLQNCNMQEMINVHLSKRRIFVPATTTDLYMHPYFHKHKIRRFTIQDHSPVHYVSPASHFKIISKYGLEGIAKTITGSEWRMLHQFFELLNGVFQFGAAANCDVCVYSQSWCHAVLSTNARGLMLLFNEHNDITRGGSTWIRSASLSSRSQLFCTINNVNCLDFRCCAAYLATM